MDALYISATGMLGQQKQIDAIAQNIANINTVGYRRNVVTFSEVAASLVTSTTPQESMASAGVSREAMQALGAGALPTLALSNTAGAMRQTGEALNLAIDGVGFLEVIRADGSPAYTRAGQLRVNTDGMLATQDGSVLASRIQIPSDTHDLRISAGGSVKALVGDSQEVVELGKIDIVNFSNTAALKPLGDNLYAASAQTGEPQRMVPGESGVGVIKQGFLENSNVQMTDEMVNLMLAQRAFELNSKVIQAADQMLGIANGLYR